jgi:hypothetical protein
VKIRCETERHDDESFALKFYADPEPRIIRPRDVEPPKSPPRIIRPNEPDTTTRRTIIRSTVLPFHKGYLYLADGTRHSTLDPVPDGTRLMLHGLISRPVW